MRFNMCSKCDQCSEHAIKAATERKRLRELERDSLDIKNNCLDSSNRLKIQIHKANLKIDKHIKECKDDKVRKLDNATIKAVLIIIAAFAASFFNVDLSELLKFLM